MVVNFKDGLYNNYTRQNIIDILSVAAMQNPLIYNLMMSPYDYILVEGDIHRSQFTADNTKNNFWIKIKGFTGDDFPIPELKAAHIYLCFRNIVFDYRSQQFIIGGCTNPEPYKGTDIANISQMNGTWEFVKMTYGLSPRSYFQQSNKAALRKPVKKSPSKALKIIDPKTGKAIKVGGAKKKSQKSKIGQKGGMNLKNLPKDLEKIINNYKKQFEKQLEKQKILKKQIDQKYKKLQKLENKERLTTKEEEELQTIDIEIPIYIKYYILNDGDYKELAISKDFQNPEDLEEDMSDYTTGEINKAKNIKKMLFGGAKKKVAKKKQVKKTKKTRKNKGKK